MAEDDFFPSLTDLDAEDVDTDDELVGDLQTIALEEDPFFSEQSDTPEPYGFTWKFDFSEGDVAVDRESQFQRIEEYDTLRDWIGHTLNTVRYETTIFGGDIGTAVPEMLGQSNTIDPVIMGRVEREIIEAISVHDRIQKVHQAVVIPIGHDLFVYIKYTTDDQILQTEVVGL